MATGKHLRPTIWPGEPMSWKTLDYEALPTASIWMNFDEPEGDLSSNDQCSLVFMLLATILLQSFSFETVLMHTDFPCILIQRFGAIILT